MSLLIQYSDLRALFRPLRVSSVCCMLFQILFIIIDAEPFLTRIKNGDFASYRAEKTGIVIKLLNLPKRNVRLSYDSKR